MLRRSHIFTALLIITIITGSVYFSLNLGINNISEIPLQSSGNIIIYSDSEFHTKASNEGWDGSGTENDPYIIANLQINGFSYGINIQYTSVYFRIENVSLTSQLTTSVYLLGASNGILINVNSTNSQGIGFCINSEILLINCTALSAATYGFTDIIYATLLNCTAINNGIDGFNVNDYATLINCTAINNNRNGFGTNAADHSTFINCAAIDNIKNGFYLYDYNDNTVINCSAFFNGERGFSVYWTCGFNYFENINASFNGLDGVELRLSNNTYFQNLTANNNGRYGYIVSAGGGNYQGSFGYNHTVIGGQLAYNGGDGAYLIFGFEVYLDNLEIFKNGWNGVGQYIDTTTVHNCHIYNNSNNGIDLMLRYYTLSQSLYYSIRNNSIHDNAGDGIGEFIQDDQMYLPNAVIENNTIYSNRNGINLDKPLNTPIKHNTIYNNSQHGIRLTRGHSIILTENSIQNNSWDGINLISTSFNTVTKNNITHNYQNGINATSSNLGNFIQNNIVYNYQNGINATSSSLGTLNTNNISYNLLHGIFAKQSSYGAGSYNIICNNGLDGLNASIDSTSQIVWSYNTVTQNGRDGLSLSCPSGQQIMEYNNITDNTNIGIWIYAVDAYIRWNNLSANGFTPIVSANPDGTTIGFNYGLSELPFTIFISASYGNGQFVLSWANVPGATGYRIYQNDTFIHNSITIEYLVTVDTPGIYNYTVIGYHNDIQFAISNTLEITIDLDPRNFTIEGFINSSYGSIFINWSTSMNAEEYAIYLNGEYLDTTTELNYTIYELIDGEYTIWVIASNEYNTSMSNTITFVITYPHPLTTLYFIESNPTNPRQTEHCWIIYDNMYWFLSWDTIYGAHNMSIYRNDVEIAFITATDRQIPATNYMMIDEIEGIQNYTLVMRNWNGIYNSTILQVNVDYSPLPWNVSLSYEALSYTVFNLVIHATYANIFKVYENNTQIGNSYNIYDNIAYFFIQPNMGEGIYIYQVNVTNEYGWVMTNTVEIVIDYTPADFLLVTNTSYIATGRALNISWIGGVYVDQYTLIVSSSPYGLPFNNIEFESDTMNTIVDIDDILYGFNPIYIYVMITTPYENVYSNNIAIHWIHCPEPMTITGSQYINDTISLSWYGNETFNFNNNVYSDLNSTYSVYQNGTLLMTNIITDHVIFELPEGQYTFTIVATNLYGNFSTDLSMYIYDNYPPVEDPNDPSDDWIIYTIISGTVVGAGGTMFFLTKKGIITIGKKVIAKSAVEIAVSGLEFDRSLCELPEFANRIECEFKHSK